MTEPGFPAPPKAGSAPVPSTLAALGRRRTPVSDPFPAEEAPTPLRPKVAAKLHPAVRMLRNYDALSEENKRLVEQLCLALRTTQDGGR